MSLSVIKEAMSVLDTISRLPTGGITFTNAIMSIFYVLSIILTTNGAEGWHKKVNEVMGENTLNPDDERNLQPIVQLLLKIRDLKAVESLESLFTQKGGSGEIDKAYMSGIDAIKNINTKVRQMAASSGMGITQYQNDADTELDPRPFEPFKSAGFVGLVLSQIPVPVRLMVFLVYSALDIVRLMTANTPIMRQLLSVCLALIELLKGDWKKSLLSFSGFFSKSMVWSGFVGKIFLELFSLMSPQLQDSIAIGTLRVTKSILLGFLIQLFKMTAPENTRIKIIKTFQELAKKKGCLDEALGAAGLPARSESLESPEGIIQDDVRNCSTEFFEDTIRAAEESKIMNVVLQLANIPTSEADVQANCKKFLTYADENGYISWKDLLVGEGLIQLAEEEENAEDDIPEELKGNAQLQGYVKELKALKERIPQVIKERKEAEEAMKAQLKGAKSPSTKEKMLNALKLNASASAAKLSAPKPAIIYDINVKLPQEVASAAGIEKTITTTVAAKGDSEEGAAASATAASPSALAAATGKKGAVDSASTSASASASPVQEASEEEKPSAGATVVATSSNPSLTPSGLSLLQPPSPPTDAQTQGTPSESSKSMPPP
jgi:hypothetical protein